MATFDWSQHQAEDTSGGATGGKFDWSQHEAEPDQEQDQQPTWSDYGKAALNAVQKGLATVDSYTGAPARAAIYAAETSPTEMGRPGAAISAFANQFGADPSKAATGDDIINAGGYVTPGSTAAKVAGFGADMLINPVNVLPVGEAVKGVASLAEKGLAPISTAVSDALGSSAARLAVKATGATGKQAAEFAPAAGRELLDRGIVNFADNPSAVAENAQKAMDAAEADKQALINGPLKNATVDRNSVYNSVRNTISQLSSDESKLGVVKHLESKLDDIASVGGKTGSDIPLSKSEDIRRGFDKAAKWSSNSDADTLEANKIVANAYRQAGENVATAVDPNLGAKFKAAKNTQSLLIPIQEAAEKRALQLQQSPHAGLLDIAAVTGGAEVGGHIGEAVAGPAGRLVGSAVGGVTGYGAKMLRPRYAAMGASALEGASKLATSIPQTVGYLSAPVSDLATRYAAIPGRPVPAMAQNQDDQNRSPALGKAHGGKIPGKAKVSGDSKQNDTVSIMASPGEGIIPRTHMTSKDAAHAFVEKMFAGGKARINPKSHMSDGGEVQDTGETLGSAIGFPGFPKPKPPKSDPPQFMSKGGVVKSKGPTAWAQRGLQNLGIYHPGHQERLLNDPKAKQLLIEASDMAPGSKAMKQIMNQIQKGWSAR